MAGDNYRFAESDSLLCYHGPMLYEAKCLKRRKTSDGKAQYFIHYKGWNSKWEEWVDDDRVLTVNTTNMNKMASLKEIHSNSKKSGAKRSITVIKEETSRNVTPPIKGRKRKHSEISSESNQTVNVPSPAEPKPKKRGRPPKNMSIKSESNEVMETSDAVITETVETHKLVEVLKVTRSFGANKTVVANKVVEATKVEVAEASNRVELNKDTEVTTDVTMAEVVETAESIEDLKNVGITETIEAFKEVLETKEIEAVGANDKSTKTPTLVGTIKTDKDVSDEIETDGVIGSVKPSEDKSICKVTETIEEIETTETMNEPLKSFWILKTNKSTESIEETDGVEAAKSIEETVETETIESLEEGTGELKGTEENKLVEETFERTEIVLKTESNEKTEEDACNVKFTVPAPVEKILPVINIPEILRKRIAYDSVMTVKLNKILKFPERYTIEKLIRAYICSKSRAPGKNYNLKITNKHRSFNIGLTIIQYFNILIHCQLLYLKEKEYGLVKKAKACLKKKLSSETLPIFFADLMYPKEFWHYVYSPTHLLRLFVLMPQLLTTTMYTNQQIAFIALCCDDFLKFVESKHEIYFTDDDYK